MRRASRYETCKQPSVRPAPTNRSLPPLSLLLSHPEMHSVLLPAAVQSEQAGAGDSQARREGGSGPPLPAAALEDSKLAKLGKREKRQRWEGGVPCTLYSAFGVIWGKISVGLPTQGEYASDCILFHVNVRIKVIENKISLLYSSL